ncbi:MAG TPA: nuclear transport factor 2 family protein [Chloroflexota bacterium]|nr:nuclear transport factor 2 family protein [Chloroflexota bacterium]
MQDPGAVVQDWQEAANAQRIDRLLDLSDPDIEVAGPRGSGYGHQLLRDWIARAGLTLKTLRMFVRGNTVVVEQHGTWRALDTGEITGETTLASVFHVVDGRVVRFARYDDLTMALGACGLSQLDEVAR